MSLYSPLFILASGGPSRVMLSPDLSFHVLDASSGAVKRLQPSLLSPVSQPDPEDAEAMAARSALKRRRAMSGYAVEAKRMKEAL